MKRVLAIDLGASSGRGILFFYDEGELRGEEVFRFPNAPLRQGDTLRWDFPALLANVKSCIAAAYARGGLDSLAIDTWGVDYGLLDADGRLIDNPFHYRDARTTGSPERLEGVTPQSLYKIAGIAPCEFNTIFQLIEDKRAGRLVDARQMAFIADLLEYDLTGVLATEPTIASTSGFFRCGGFDARGRALVGMPASFYPPVLATGTVLGNVLPSILQELGIPTGEKIAVIKGAEHDTACAFCAVPSAEQAPLILSSGTWSLFGTKLAAPLTEDRALRCGYTNEIAADGNVRLLKNIMGMWLIQECRAQWSAQGKELGYAEIAALAQESGGDALIDVADPIFNPPGKMADRITAYAACTQGTVLTDIGAIADCVYRGLALEYALAYEELCALTGRRYRELNVIGGGSNNAYLNQLTADALGIPVIAGPAEGSALGNALTQLTALGELPDYRATTALAVKIVRTRRFLPSGNEKTRAHALDNYRILKRKHDRETLQSDASV